MIQKIKRYSFFIVIILCLIIPAMIYTKKANKILDVKDPEKIKDKKISSILLTTSMVIMIIFLVCEYMIYIQNPNSDEYYEVMR
jgi:magnesium-transporting ATPase (P-type)